MAYSLKGRNVLVTGGSRGLGAVICNLFAQEGSNVAVNYQSSADRAQDVAATVQGHGARATIIQGDVAKQADCRRMVDETIKSLGGIDVVIHNAGWTEFETFGDLDAMTEEQWDKCWAINTKAIHHLLKAAKPTFEQNPEGGVVINTSSVAATGPMGSSMAYSVTKAAGLHLMKCLAQTQGPKIRVHSVVPGHLDTEWGAKFSDEHVEKVKNLAPLKKVPLLEEVADAFVFLAKNSSMTGVALRVGESLRVQAKMI